MTKKGDFNPSIVGAFFGKHDTIDKAIKEINQQGGMRVRELRIVDISMPLDERTEQNINFLKSFSMPMLKRFLEIDFPFRNLLEKQIEKQGLKLMKYEPWTVMRRHKLLWSGFTPLACDVKYKSEYTKEENKILDKLSKFESDYQDEETLIKKAIDESIK